MYIKIMRYAQDLRLSFDSEQNQRMDRKIQQDSKREVDLLTGDGRRDV